MKYLYTVWLRELSLEDDDPDVEWPACFLIDAATDRSGLRWGDCLSQRHAQGNHRRVVRSTIEAMDTCNLPGIEDLPLVREGEDVTDEEIGW